MYTRAYKNRHLHFILIHLFFAVLATGFLFSIDEGQNNIRWMGHIGNWVPFSIYCTFFILVQWVVRGMFFKHFSAYLQNILAAMVSSFFLTVLLMIVFS